MRTSVTIRSKGSASDHEGNIEVSSVKGKGARFAVLLPLASSRSRAERRAFDLRAEPTPDTQSK